MHVSIGDIILIEIKMCHLPYFVLIFSHVSMSPLFSLRAEVTRIMYKYEKLSYYATGIIPHVGGKSQQAIFRARLRNRYLQGVLFAAEPIPFIPEPSYILHVKI